MDGVFFPGSLPPKSGGKIRVAHFDRRDREISRHERQSRDIRKEKGFTLVEPQADMYRYLGAHVEEQEGVTGTRFGVWAPNASAVSVLCDKNQWTPDKAILHGSDSGIWSGFVPGIGHGDAYKYAVRTQAGEWLEKSDPYAFATEHPPKTASIVYDFPEFEWTDSEWISRRESGNYLKEPISTYEVHIGSWKRPTDGRKYFNYRELAHMLVDYAHEMGFTHLQLMPITEYPFDGSWGYQATGYFAPTSRYGTPDDFKYFVDYCHKCDVGVLIDWVPAHFPCDGHALGRFDGTALYEHADPRQGFHPDWNTYIFFYGREEVRNFLLSSARFWCEMYHVDGIRVDAVASMLYLDYSRNEGEWIPNQFGGRENLEAIDFLKHLNSHLHERFPGILTIAEESTSWGGVSKPVYEGGLGFSLKWDMGWMNDTLEYLHHEPIHRSHHQNELSFRMIYAFTENFVLPLSHDEVVHGKGALLSQMPGSFQEQFANLRLLYGYQYTMPGKKLLFMGSELGMWTEWNHDLQLDWALMGHTYHDGIRRLVGDLNALYRSEPALHYGDSASEHFQWIQADDHANSVFAYYRTGETANDCMIVVCNFTPVVRKPYRIGVPIAGYYTEKMNTDASIYGGSNVGNAGGLYTEPIPQHGQDHSIVLTLPPLGMLIMKAKEG